jgi:hypothetical protein
MFSQIHDIVFHGNGGYDWETVYYMPIWLRKFTFNKVKEFYDKQNEEKDKIENTLANRSNKNDLSRPNIAPKQPTPTYIVKAPKK